MGNAELHKFILIVIIVLCNQIPDVLPAPLSYYYAIPYFLRFMIDGVALVFLIVVADWDYKIPGYALLIICAQSLSLFNHIIMLAMNGAIREWPLEAFANIHDYYQPMLKAVFISKVVALLWGFNGVLKRYNSDDNLSFNDDISRNHGFAARLYHDHFRAKRNKD